MKILIIDDDTFFRTFYAGKLTQAGYQVITAGDGEEGFAKLQQEQPDLVLLDLIMPKSDGFEVLQKLSQTKTNTIPPVIIFSTLEQQQDIEEVKKLGAVDYINKGTEDWQSTLAKISSYMKQ